MTLPSSPTVAEDAVFRKISWRLIPFLFVLYIAAFLDRVNVGFAKLHMNDALGFSEEIYGLGAGLFFVGYFLFEVPSNLILHWVGARATISRIMILWGLISASMMFVRDPMMFYALRFLLGVAEAGFFPGVIFYLTGWYPSRQRAKAISLFMTATALSGVVGGPVSASLLQLHGWHGLDGWQWLFLLEGLPSVLLGIAVLFLLPNGPAEVRWLSGDEKSWLDARLRDDTPPGSHSHDFVAALLDRRVWHLAFLYLALITPLYGFTLWLPSLIKELVGKDELLIGWLTTVPYLMAALAMVLVGWSSDRSGERRLHVSLSAFVGGLGLGLAATMTGAAPGVAALVVAAVGIWAALGPFWTLPSRFLDGKAAAAGIALINSIGNLGGFAGAYLLGYLKDQTGGFSAGLLVLAAFLAAGGVLALFVRR